MRTMWHLVCVIAMVVGFTGLASVAGAGELTAPAAHDLAAQGQITIVDVRRPGEWADTGLPARATGISLHNAIFMIRGDFIDDVLMAVGGDRTMPVALICAGGVRSAAAKALLKDAGFTNVHDINEGMMGNGRDPGWLAHDLPRVPCPNC